MARRPRMVIPGQPLHIVQRGNNRQAVFFAEQDYLTYLECLRDAAFQQGCWVHAYVLMTNHVHLLLTPTQETSLSRCIQAVGRNYVRYINGHYRRSGTLWEGRFKSAMIDSAQYLLACYRYIELVCLCSCKTDIPSIPGHKSSASEHGRTSAALSLVEFSCQCVGSTPGCYYAAPDVS